MERHSDDLELLDGIPRWVWRLDDLFSKMGRDEGLYEIPRLATAEAVSRGVSKFWLAKRLEDCRAARNRTTGVLKDVS